MSDLQWPAQLKARVFIRQYPSVRERVLHVFFRLKKHDFYVFEMTYQKVVRSQQKFCRQYVKMSSYTSLSDHRNNYSDSQLPECDPFWSIAECECL